MMTIYPKGVRVFGPKENAPSFIHKNKQGEVETYDGVGGRIDKVERIKFKIRQQLNGAGSRNPVIL